MLLLGGAANCHYDVSADVNCGLRFGVSSSSRLTDWLVRVEGSKADLTALIRQ